MKRGQLTPLFEVYRAAQRLQADAFAAYAFSWLRERMAFDTSVLITTFEKHAAWVDAHFCGIDDPRALMESHAKVRHLDVLTMQLFAKPMVAQRQDADAPELTAPRFAPLREHQRRFKGWYTVCIVTPSPQHQTSTVLIVCRGKRRSRFSDSDVAVVQDVGPHLAEALAVNRAIWLPRNSGPDTGALPVARLDAEGRFVQTTTAFVRLFWPTAPPSTAFLSEKARLALRQRRPWPLPDGRHALYGEPEDSGDWLLRIRRTSAFDTLSTRERQVATLFGGGATYKAIATKLGVAPSTARNHLQNIYAKLGITDRSELTALVSGV